MAEQTTDGGKPLTGRKVFAIFAGAFALIIGVNIFMAYSAVGTFPGLEVDNSYVASQSFDADRAAQEALGWDVSAAFEGEDAVALTIIGPNGQPARVEAIEGTIGRATQRTDDQVLTFTRNDRGVHVASITPLDAGKWELRFFATAANGVTFKQRIELIISEE
ncbi:FixH family protein [Sinisalibacter aestuarii]|uniref:RdxH n=1 Tax=Sinisalibacter aestuarii TaxID=2949426 RepID=A0ABQ5LN15_9RHOB|nr:FixH family protein [Sinisalibacter aestuarii]GKY86173.1 RdxH [Sinisalibacter aestuarii]